MEWLLHSREQPHINRASPPTQHGTQGDHHQLIEVMHSRCAGLPTPPRMRQNWSKMTSRGVVLPQIGRIDHSRARQALIRLSRGAQLRFPCPLSQESGESAAVRMVGQPYEKDSNTEDE